MAKKKTSRRRKKLPRVHAVSAAIDNVKLAKARSALTLFIRYRGQRIGELQVGSGSVYWWGKGRKDCNYKRLTWSEFASAMNRIAYGK